MLCCPLSLVTFFSNCAENLELDSVLRPSGASLYANEVVEVADQYGQVATQIKPDRVDRKLLEVLATS